MIDLVQRSTIHGVNHIYSEKNKIIKFFWLFLFLFGIAGIIVNVVLVSKKYISNPVIFSQTLDHEPFIYPDFTFCSPTAPFHLVGNPPVNDYWKQTFKQSNGISKMLLNKTDIFEIVESDGEEQLEVGQRTVAMSTADPLKLEAHNFANLVIRISYSHAHSGIYFLQEPFSKNNTNIYSFSQLFSTQIVQIRYNIPCYTFHIDKYKSVNQNEVESVDLFLRFDYDSYQIFNSSDVERSIFFYMHRKKEIPQKYKVLNPGFENIIDLSQSRHKYYNYRRPCRKELFKIELYDVLLQSTKEFEGDEEDCKKIISQELFVRNCGCYSPFLPIYKNESGFPRICLNATMFSIEHVVKNAKCMEEVYKRYRNESDFNKIAKRNCSIYKPIKCDSITYNINQRQEIIAELWSNSTSEAARRFLGKAYMNAFNVSKIDKDFLMKLRDTLIILTVKRENSLGDLYEEQREYPFSQLLSDIGGLMGLWLGMSVVGLFELAEYFYLYTKGIYASCSIETPSNEKRLQPVSSTNV